MILDRVTFTGADDSVDPAALVLLSRTYPFIEWGILFSKFSQGSSRFPTPHWIRALEHTRAIEQPTMRLSAHLCGGWVSDLVLRGDFSWREIATPSTYARIQINFHGQFHRACAAFQSLLHQIQEQVILQCDGVNDLVVANLAARQLAVPLFDQSGGAGLSPTTWPRAWTQTYCGYAGGLGPDNIVAELDRIDRVCDADDRIWIDMERKVRSDDDHVFDLDRVQAVCEAVEPFVRQA